MLAKLGKNLRSSREVGVEYRNNTGKTIFIAITLQFSTPSSSVYFMLNDEAMVQIRDGADEYTHIMLPIGANDTYKLTGGTISSWWEYTTI